MLRTTRILSAASRGTINRFFVSPLRSLSKSTTQSISFDLKKALLIDQTWLLQQYWLTAGTWGTIACKNQEEIQKIEVAVKALDVFLLDLKQANSSQDLKRAFKNYYPLYLGERYYNSEQHKFYEYVLEHFIFDKHHPDLFKVLTSHYKNITSQTIIERIEHDFQKIKQSLIAINDLLAKHHIYQQIAPNPSFCDAILSAKSEVDIVMAIYTLNSGYNFEGWMSFRILHVEDIDWFFPLVILKMSSSDIPEALAQMKHTLMLLGMNSKEYSNVASNCRRGSFLDDIGHDKHSSGRLTYPVHIYNQADGELDVFGKGTRYQFTFESMSFNQRKSALIYTLNAMLKKRLSYTNYPLLDDVLNAKKQFEMAQREEDLMITALDLHANIRLREDDYYFHRFDVLDIVEFYVFGYGHFFNLHEIIHYYDLHLSHVQKQQAKVQEIEFICDDNNLDQISHPKCL